MAKAKTSSRAATSDQRLRVLEAELARAAERHRLAKQAVKEAKADAKSAKKETKRARKALAAAQEEEELAVVTVVTQKARSAAPSSTAIRAIKAAKSAADASSASPKRRIADSPERPRPVRRRKKPVVADAEATHASSSGTADSSTEEAIAGTDASQQTDLATVDSAAEVKPG